MTSEEFKLRMLSLYGAMRFYSYRLPQVKPDLLIAYAARDIVKDFEHYGFYRLNHEQKNLRIKAINFILGELNRCYLYAKDHDAPKAKAVIKFNILFLNKILNLENSAKNPQNIDSKLILKYLIDEAQAKKTP